MPHIDLDRNALTDGLYEYLSKANGGAMVRMLVTAYQDKAALEDLVNSRHAESYRAVRDLLARVAVVLDAAEDELGDVTEGYADKYCARLNALKVQP